MAEQITRLLVDTFDPEATPHQRIRGLQGWMVFFTRCESDGDVWYQEACSVGHMNMIEIVVDDQSVDMQEMRAMMAGAPGWTYRS